MLNLTVAIIASMIVMLISAGAGIYLARYKSSISEMLGMMIGMTQGMMTGIAVGYFIGAATDMFISNLVGVSIGLIFGIVFGRVGGLMGMMDGGMGGTMGGMMGAMLGVMLQFLYEGAAIAVTSVLVSAIYLISMIALLLLVIRWAKAQMEIDPVCKMKVDGSRCKITSEYKGKTYYFCAHGCKLDFDQNPQKYLIEVTQK